MSLLFSTSSERVRLLRKSFCVVCDCILFIFIFITPTCFDITMTRKIFVNVQNVTTNIPSDIFNNLSSKTINLMKALIF